MRAAKVQASLRICTVSPEPSLLAHTSSESRGTFRQKARSLAPLNGWACAVEICHDGMFEDTNSLDGAQLIIAKSLQQSFQAFPRFYWMPQCCHVMDQLQNLIGCEQSFEHGQKTRCNWFLVTQRFYWSLRSLCGVWFSSQIGFCLRSSRIHKDKGKDYLQPIGNCDWSLMWPWLISASSATGRPLVAKWFPSGAVHSPLGLHGMECEHSENGMFI